MRLRKTKYSPVKGVTQKNGNLYTRIGESYIGIITPTEFKFCEQEYETLKKTSPNMTSEWYALTLRILLEKNKNLFRDDVSVGEPVKQYNKTLRVSVIDTIKKKSKEVNMTESQYIEYLVESVDV